MTTNLQGNSHAETLVAQARCRHGEWRCAWSLKSDRYGAGTIHWGYHTLYPCFRLGADIGGIGRVEGTETLRSTLYGAVGGYDVPVSDRWLVGGLGWIFPWAGSSGQQQCGY